MLWVMMASHGGTSNLMLWVMMASHGGTLCNAMGDDG